MARWMHLTPVLLFACGPGIDDGTYGSAGLGEPCDVSLDCKAPYTCSSQYSPRQRCVETGRLPSQWGSRKWDWGLDVAVGSRDEITVSGWTGGSLDQQSELGNADAFVTRFAADGTKLWTRQWGTAGVDAATAVASTEDGSLYAVGGLNGLIADQDPNLLDATATEADAFLARFDAGGKLKWIKSIDSGRGDGALTLAVSEAHGVTLAGGTTGDLAANNRGSWDVFIARYSLDGALLWNDQFGTAQIELGLSLAYDDRGNTYLAGYTDGALTEQGEGSGDAYLAKYSAQGRQLWARQWGTSGREQAQAVGVGPRGEIYVASRVSGAAPGDAADIEISRWTEQGDRLWARTWGTRQRDEPFSAAIAQDGSIFVSGLTDGTFRGQQSAGARDLFVAKFDAQGLPVSTYQHGTAKLDWSSGIATTSDERVVVVGTSSGDFAAVNRGQTDVIIDALNMD